MEFLSRFVYSGAVVGVDDEDETLGACCGVDPNSQQLSSNVDGMSTEEKRWKESWDERRHNEGN